MQPAKKKFSARDQCNVPCLRLIEKHCNLQNKISRVRQALIYKKKNTTTGIRITKYVAKLHLHKIAQMDRIRSLSNVSCFS